jgi:hypothetical protein
MDTKTNLLIHKKKKLRLVVAGIIRKGFLSQLKDNKIDGDPREPRADPEEEDTDNEHFELHSPHEQANKPDCRHYATDDKTKYTCGVENEPEYGTELISERGVGKGKNKPD